MPLENWRTLIRTRLMATVEDYRSANAGDLIAVYPTRPEDLTSRTPLRVRRSRGSETFDFSASRSACAKRARR